MKWRTLITLVLSIAALIAWSFWLRRDSDDLQDTAVRTPRGYYLNGARVRQTGPNGDARYSLRAQRIEQDVTDNQINLEQVELDYRSDSGASWLLSAEHGALDNAAQRADFRGHVLIRPTSQPGSNTHLQTDTLHLDMQTQQASTHDAVTLQMNEQQLTARGLQANLKEQKLRLESQVHGVFQIQSNIPSASP